MESIASLPESVAQAFLRAINRQDPVALAALMTPNHRFVDSMGVVVEGQEKMQAGWTAYFRMVPDYTVAIEETFASGPVVVMIGVAMGTYTPNGKPHPENRWKTPIAIRAQIEEGHIAEWRVYADNEPVRRVIAQAK